MSGLLVLEFIILGIVAPVIGLHSSDYTESISLLCDEMILMEEL